MPASEYRSNEFRDAVRANGETRARRRAQICEVTFRASLVGVSVSSCQEGKPHSMHPSTIQGKEKRPRQAQFEKEMGNCKSGDSKSVGRSGKKGARRGGCGWRTRVSVIYSRYGVVILLRSSMMDKLRFLPPASVWGHQKEAPLTCIMEWVQRRSTW